MSEWTEDALRSNHETLRFWYSDLSLADLNRQMILNFTEKREVVQEKDKEVSSEFKWVKEIAPSKVINPYKREGSKNFFKGKKPCNNVILYYTTSHFQM